MSKFDKIPDELLEKLREAFSRPADPDLIPDLPEVPDLEELADQGKTIILFIKRGLRGGKNKDS